MLLPSVNENRFLHLNSIAHEGKVVVFGTTILAGQNDTGQIWYTVRQDGFEDSYLNKPAEDRTGWEDWRVLQFPNEEADDPSMVERETNELTDNNKEKGNFILRSVYRSKDRTAVAPVQLVSALGHIYVFRQSKENTLLVDRFVLDGMTNELVSKLDVRFKRSRQKYVPYQKTDNKKKGTRITLTQVDTLDFQDADGRPFFEPTTELCLIKNVVNGWFSVVLVPTNEHDHYRWHIFAYNNNTEQVEMISMRSSEEGLFDVRDGAAPLGTSGIIRRTLELSTLELTNKDSGFALKPMNGLAATKYDVQKEVTVKGESQFVKEATRILLAIPTDDGNTAALSFGLAADGTLAQIGENGDHYIWRADERDVILPLNTLDEIKAIGDSSSVLQGIISRLGSGDDDRVVISSDQVDGLARNDMIEIKDTSDYNGLYEVEYVNQNIFAIVPKQAGLTSLGQWKKVEAETTGLVFDGIIKGYERTDDGYLLVSCENHGLGNDDEVEVQIVGTVDYNAVYRVASVTENEFTIERKWQPGEAVNIIKKAKKRRGIQFDGVSDYIEIPHAPELSLDTFTIEAWVNPSKTQVGWSTLVAKTRQTDSNEFNYRMYLTEKLNFGFHCSVAPVGNIILTSRKSLKPGVWSHIAATWDGAKSSLYLDGELDVFEWISIGDKSLAQNNAPLLIGGGPGVYWFAGKIADVRVLNQARGAQEIKNSMYLQLTGMETGLVGYWRLGAIAEGPERKVVDFSVNGFDGVVHGNAFVSEVSLQRKLLNDLNAIQYSNEDLFAVSQGATYEESFEFRLLKDSTMIDPSKNKNPFKFSYWGKKNRNAEKRTPEDPKQENPFSIEQKFGGPVNGWYTASCRFTVPDGVSLVRLFEISLPDDDPGGDWESIEIRKHHIQSSSNSITEARFTDDISLTTLADDQQALTALKELDSLENEAGTLLKEKHYLEMLLLNDANWKALVDAKNKHIQEAEKLVREWNSQLEFWKAESARALLIADFTWTHSRDYGAWTDYDHKTWNLKIGTHTPPKRRDWYPDGKKVPYGLEDTYYDGCASFVVRTIGKNTDAEHIKRQLAYYSDDRNSPKARLETLRKELAQLVAERKTDRTALNARVEKIKKDLPTLTNQFASLYTRVLTGVAEARQATHIMPDLRTDSRGLETKGALLGFVRSSSRISAIETSEGNVQLSYFDTAGRMRQTNYDATADSTNSRFEEWLPDGLRSCINFNRSQGPLTLPAERQLTLHEASTIEAWVSFPLAEPDEAGGANQPKYWRCLAGSEDGKDGYLVIEYDPALDVELLGIRVDGEFRSSGYDLTPISAGWHHLAVAANNGTTSFFIDGRKVSSYPLAEKLEQARKVEKESSSDARKLVETRHRLEVAKSNQDQRAIQDAAREVAELEQKPETKKQADEITAAREVALAKQPDQPITKLGAMPGALPFGKVAELRIWSVALTEEEIEVNSKTLLSGNEPGLLAYYPMNEASGNTVSDKTGKGHGGTVNGLKWWGCAAPIGNLGHTVMQFDGVENYIKIPHAPELSLDIFTIEAWVNPSATQEWCTIVSKDAGPAGDGDRRPRFNYRMYLEKALKFCIEGNTQSGGSLSLTSRNPLKPGVWSHIAATYNGNRLCIYLDGKLDKSEYYSDYRFAQNNGPLLIGGGPSQLCFAGKIADVRVWNQVRSESEIKAAMNRRLSGQEPGLVGSWPLNEISLKGGQVGTEPSLITDDSSLLIGGDAVVSAEYVTYGQDPETGQKSSMMRRFLAAPTSKGALVLSEKRIEMLDLKWIGNAQFDPTLLGYIEGAPPLPSENLTVEGNYNGATSVELTMAENVDFQWNREQEIGLGASAELFIGVDQEIKLTKSAGVGAEVGMEEKALETRKGFAANLAKVYSSLNASSITASSGTAVSDRLELRGTQEETAKFPHLGQRFIPKNIGYALVVSGIADIFITRLRKSGRMISYVVLPVPEIPPDVNTITFLINPAYTMQGSLDGMTGSGATSQRFFKHVPEMRAQYGALYPASYYRLKETYALKEQIEYRDKRREAYFRQFDVRLIATPLGDDTDLDREVENAEYYTGTATVGTPDASAQLDAEINTLKERIKVLESKASRSQDESNELRDKQSELTGKEGQKQKFFNDEIDQFRKPKSGSENSSAAQKRSEIEKQISNIQQAVHATESLARWQKKMEHIQILAGKRNIANTYVWDADGGMHSESQQFANTIEHMIGGSFSHDGAAGGEGGFKALGTGFELTALVTANLTQIMSKTETRSKAFELNVDVSGVESTGITDHDDYPIQPGEKVDRYRFMSFYLEGSTENFNSFFNEVVDPEWLASNDEEARALRQAKGKANKTWRVFHRVTYVERPALMGFGRDIRSLTKEEEMPDNKQLQAQIEELKKNNVDLATKIDKILDLLDPG